VTDSIPVVERKAIGQTRALLDVNVTDPNGALRTLEAAGDADNEVRDKTLRALAFILGPATAKREG